MTMRSRLLMLTGLALLLPAAAGTRPISSDPERARPWLPEDGIRPVAAWT